MIPVRGVDHVLVLAASDRALELADDVLRVDRAQRVVKLHRRRDAERHRLELAGRRLLLQRVEILAGQLQQLACAWSSVIQPSIDDAAHVLVGRDEIELLADLAACTTSNG